MLAAVLYFTYHGTLMPFASSKHLLAACLQRAFKMMVGIGSLRIVNRADPIPAVPAAVGLRYRHVGPPVWFDRRGMHLHERPLWDQASRHIPMLMRRVTHITDDCPMCSCWSPS